MRALLMLVCAWSVASPPAVASARTVRRLHLSPRHPQVVLAERDTAYGVLRVEFPVGSADDGGAHGLTRLSQYAVLRANRRLPYGALVPELFGAGAEIAIETGVRHSAFTLTAPREEFPRLAEKVLELCLAPRLDLTGLTAARDRLLQDQLSAEASNLVPLLAQIATDEQPYHNPPFGEAHTVRRITAAEVKRHVARHMQPAQARVYAVGPITAQQLRGWLRSHKGGPARRAIRRQPLRPGVYAMETPMELHVVAYPIALRDTREVATALVLSAMLEESLTWHFRGLGIAYSVPVWPLRRGWIDLMLIVLPIYSAEQVPVEQELGAALTQLLVTDGAEAEARFERNRSYVRHMLARAEDDPRALLDLLMLGRAEADWYDGLAGALENMHRADLVASARQWLDRGDATHVRFSPRPIDSVVEAGP